MSTTYDVIVAGGGAAGSTAAAFLARAHRKTVLIDKGIDHGYAGSFNALGFFPGLPASTSGKTFLERLRQAAEQSKAEVLTKTVTGVDFSSSPLSLTMNAGEHLSAKVIILATGAAERVNVLEGEQRFRGKGVWYDAFLEGPEVQHKTVAVIGKSPSAVEEALILARFVEKIFFIIPSSKLDISEKLHRTLEAEKKIECLFSTSLKKISGTDHVNAITILSSGQEKELHVHGVFPYVHDFHPTNDYLGSAVELTEKRCILVDSTLATSVKGVFACGDILCGRPQLPAIATAQGIMAAINADSFLNSHP